MRTTRRLSGAVERIRLQGTGAHLRAVFEAARQVLLLGHLDTVWPVGPLARIPVREVDGRLYGPAWST